jgi:SAM-dependent methyltransferase
VVVIGVVTAAVAAAAIADAAAPVGPSDRATHCPVCAGTDLHDDTARWTGPDPDRNATMSRCGGCGTVFVDPVPDAATLAAAYPADFYGVRRGETERIEEWFLARRLRIAGPVAGRHVLDVGSGDGKFLRRCRDAGAGSVTGVEPSATGRTATEVLGIGVVGGLDELPAGKTYDLVTMWHAFEHAPDPAATAASVAGRVAPGGRLVLALPNVESWEAERFGNDWFHLDLPRHLVFPPAVALRSLVEREGLRHVRTHRFSAEYDPFGLLQSGLNRVGRRHNALYHRLKRKQPLSAYDRRGRREVVAELVTLPVTGTVAVAGSALLATRRRAGTYTSVFERPR